MKKSLSIILSIIMALSALSVFSVMAVAQSSVGSVYLSKDEFEYDGKIKKPKVCAYDKNDKKISSKYYKVKYPKAKNIGNYKVKVVFKGGYHKTKYLKFSILPKKVRNVNTQAISGNSFSVSWNAVNDADGYKIYVYNEKENAYKLYTTLNTASAVIEKSEATGNEVDFYIVSFKIIGNKTYRSKPAHCSFK